MRALLKGTTALVVLTAIAGYSGSAKAADVVEAAAPDYSWSGFYIGAYAGAGAHLITGEVAAPGLELANDSSAADGLLAGAMAGFNWQVSERVVLGLQGDISFHDMKALEFMANADFDPDFIASASLRAGYLLTPETLFYVIGGYSYAEFEVGEILGIEPSDDETFDGFHVGAGMETRLTDRLTARIEYRYTEFGSERTFEALGAIADATPHMHTGTLGLAFNLFPTPGEGAEVAPAADVVEPAASWTGFYLGLNGGAGAFVAEELAPSRLSAGGEGFLGSAMAGANWQAGERFVLGLQGDIGLADGMEWDVTVDIPAGPVFQNIGMQLDWFASASVRAGWLASPWTMVYVIGGYSYAEFDSESTLVAGVPFGSFDQTETFDGFHAGAGIEAMLTDSLTARVEYRYTDYSAHHVEVFGGLSPGIEFDPSTHTGTIGIAWLFNAQ